MSKVSNQIDSIIRNAGWAKNFAPFSNFEKYKKVTGIVWVTEDMFNDADNEQKLLWMIAGGVNFAKGSKYPDEPVRPSVIPNTPEQDAIQESIIAQVNAATSKLTINVDGTMNNITIPDNGIAVTLVGEVQSGATITNLSAKPLIIDNTGTEDWPDIIVDVPNTSKAGYVTLKGQYNNVWCGGQYILASGAKINGEIVFDSSLEGLGALSVTADWVENVKVVSYNTNDLAIYNSTADEVLESIEVVAPNATVTMEGEWNKVVASTGQDTLKLNPTFHAEELLVSKGSVIICNADPEDACSNITVVDGSCNVYTVNLGTDEKMAANAGVYNMTGDFSGSTFMSFYTTTRGHFRLNLNGHSIATTNTKTAGLLQRGVKTVVDICGDGEINSASYGYHLNTTGNVANIYGGHWIAATHAAYAETGVMNIYGGKFEVSGDDKRYVINCKDANYQAGTAKINVYGGEFVDFDPAHSPSEAGQPSFVADGYKSVRIDEHTWKVVPEDEEIEPWAEPEAESAAE